MRAANEPQHRHNGDIMRAALPAAPGGDDHADLAGAAWNVPQAPFRVYANTYYVGTHELSAILVASSQGLVLIDGDLAESAPQIAGPIWAEQSAF